MGKGIGEDYSAVYGWSEVKTVCNVFEFYYIRPDEWWNQGHSAWNNCALPS